MSTPFANGAVSPRRAPAFLAVLLTALVVAAWGRVLGLLVHQWMHDPNYAHSIFLPFLALFLAWRRRGALAITPARREPFGLVLMLVAAVLLVAGSAAAEHFTARVSLVLMLAAVYITFQGRARSRILLVPWLLVVLSIPLPYIVYYRLTFPLQIFSSRAAASILAALGMPVVRMGNIIHLEQYTLEIVTACSGLRSMMTLAAMSVFAGDLFRLSWGGRLVLVVVSIPIAVAANTARLLSTAALSALAGPKVADGFLHGVSGIVVFMLGIALLLGVGRVLEWAGSRRSPR